MMRIWQAMLLQALASWSVWSWYISRISNGSDEMWHLAAVVALAALGLRGDVRQAVPATQLCALAAANVVVALLQGLLPPSVGGLVCVVGLASLVSRALGMPWWHPAPALLGALALPVSASMHFFVGHPLKLATVHLAQPMLSMTGASVVLQGAALSSGGTVVLVDAPCAGVDTLGVTLLLAVGTSLLRRHSARQTWMMLLLSMGCVVVANAMRVSSLFWMETITSVPPTLHELLGLAAFLAAAVVLVFTGARLHSMPRAGGAP